MRIRLKRRFCRGVELTESQFAYQAELHGELQLATGGALVFGLGAGGAGEVMGRLHRPSLKAVYKYTISFSGIELDGKVWCAQIWFCWISTGYANGLPPELAAEAAEEERWVGSGHLEAFKPSAEHQRLIDLTSLAQVAANEVLGVPPGQVVTLDFVEARKSPREAGFRVGACD